MLTSPKEDIIVSSLGYVEKASLWLLETASGNVSSVQLSDAKYLTLHGGRDGHFAVLHHHNGDVIEITAHSFSDPPKILARITIRGLDGGTRFEGDTQVWQSLPKAYIAYFKRPGLSDFHLFMVEPVRPAVEIVELDWYGETYDKGYQGVTGVIEVPSRALLIVSVQRDSHPVILDLETKKMVGKLTLADRAGNSTLRFRQFANELWADDYDTVLRIDPEAWRVRDSKRLQGALTGCQQFIGAFAFNKDETLCAVARPFSGDVVALDTTRFKITHTCTLGHQPLEVSLLSNGKVWARDWKTGKVLNGTLKRKWFA